MHPALFFMGIWDLNIGKKHIFWLKNGSFCYEMPTLAYHNSLNKRARAVFYLILEEQTKFYLFLIKNWIPALFLMGIWKLNIGKKHIFWLKNGSFCYETPTLAYHNSLNKRARAVFLFDSRRANKVLLVSNKKPGT